MIRRTAAAAMMIAVTSVPTLGAQTQGEGANGAPEYVGAIVCKSCHGQQTENDAFRVWSLSKHARTWVQLGTGDVERIDPQARGLVPDGLARSIAHEARRLGTETECLECHSTASTAPQSAKAATFHPEDGVQCEACHGPGGQHVEAASMGEGAAAIRRRQLEFCAAACHRHKPSHAPFMDCNFDPKKAWARIAH